MKSPVRVLAALVLLLPALARAADEYAAARNKMVDEEIVAAGVKDPRVVKAMRNVPRHEFVPLNLRNDYSYLDMALPIGDAQTISPPFVVAYMTEQLDPQPTDRVLEIGTGSGYQAAVLSGLVREVYSIEIVPSLGRQAARTLKRLGYDNVYTKVGDGFLGWPEHAPFDKIIVTCSPERIPKPLVEQLAEGGRMVIPTGERYQQMLYLMRKTDGELVTEALRATLFVPMTGHAEEGRQVQPDPANPTLRNGDFEETVGDPPSVAGWHYQRQAEVVSGGDGPSGDNYLRFSNEEPGRGCRALQGFAVDGREVERIELSFWIKGKGIRPGQTRVQMPVVGIAFYDENRGAAGHSILGPWRDTFGWRQVRGTFTVPPRAREAIIRIGMFGGVGEISFDGMEMRVVGR